jgi:hypothetical protein
VYIISPQYVFADFCMIKNLVDRSLPLVSITRTGQYGQNRQNRTGRTDQAERDRQNRTCRIGKVEQDRQNRTGGQDTGRFG